MTNEPTLPAQDTAEDCPALPKAYKIYYFLTLIASLLGAAVQIILYVTRYDTSVGMYESDSLMAKLFIGYAVVAVIGILSMPLLFRMKNEVKTLREGGTPMLFSSVLCAFILIALLIMRFVFGQANLSQKGGAGVLALLEMLMLLPTAVYFLLPVLTKRTSGKAALLLGFAPVLWCMLYLMRIYFDRTVALGSPARILTLLSLLGSTLFFLLQLRMQVGKPKTALLLMSVNLGVFLGAISAIPLISASFISRWDMTGDAMYSMVQVCFLAYFITRANTFFTENK